MGRDSYEHEHRRDNPTRDRRDNQDRRTRKRTRAEGDGEDDYRANGRGSSRGDREERHTKVPRRESEKRAMERQERNAEKERVRARQQEKHSRDWVHRRSRSRSRDRHRDRDRDRHSKHSHHRREEPLTAEEKEAAAQKQRDKEQAELDDEVTKRRKRAEVWQAEQRRRAEQSGAAQPQIKEEEDETGQQAGWTLDDEGDEEDEADQLLPGQQEGTDEVVPEAEPAAELEAPADNKTAIKAEPADAEDEEDPLDAFMQGLQPAAQQQDTVMPDVKVERQAENGNAASRTAGRAPKRRGKTRYDTSSSSEDLGSDDQDSDDEEWAKNVTAGKLSKGEKLGVVDHSTMNYKPFRRDFYIEVPELARMSDEEVTEHRKQLDGIKVRGKDIPKPIRSWTQCGLSSRALEVMRKANFSAPMPIQAQALPVIMSGRDCIGIAKTGSGKTLAFVLPMLRHIKDQRPLESGDGPVALVMAPTRELVTQIGKDVLRFSKQLALTCICVYGGSGVGAQISELKRGAEIIVCTPGRMIDVLVTSAGKITNLHRVTYLVMDEADRMFDMGFEPQINLIVSNIRPDRQTVMFSATFPRSVEVLAKRVLQLPVEIQVGGRSVVNKDIEQIVEMRPEGERFLRLLEILGQWYEKGKILVFVQTQEGCDELFRDLLKVGYPCVSLHGGKDQMDRESTLNDFKGDVSNLLIATSIAARGLDVKELILVVNYDPPNHHEDYVHRVGRTGRAGNKGTAITFISQEEERYAPDLVKALKESGAAVPQDLQRLSDDFAGKCKAGTAHIHGSGFGGSGFKFDTGEEDAQKVQRQLAAKQAAKDGADSDSDDGGIIEVDEDMMRQREFAAAVAAAAAAPLPEGQTELTPEMIARRKAAQEVAIRIAREGMQTMPRPPPGASVQTGSSAPPFMDNAAVLAAAQAAAMKIAQEHGVPHSVPILPSAARAQHPGAPWGGEGERASHFEAELEINHFPQTARWKVTHRDTLGQLNELTGAAVTTKGTYVLPNKPVPEGERRLYLLIEGPSEAIVKRAKTEIKRIIEEMTEKAMRRDNPSLM